MIQRTLTDALLDRAEAHMTDQQPTDALQATLAALVREQQTANLITGLNTPGLFPDQIAAEVRAAIQDRTGTWT